MNGWIGKFWIKDCVIRDGGSGGGILNHLSRSLCYRAVGLGGWMDVCFGRIGAVIVLFGCLWNERSGWTAGRVFWPGLCVAMANQT